MVHISSHITDFVMQFRPAPRRWTSRVKATRCSRHVLAAVLFSVATTSASAQTDYYNTDAGRPLTIEDATATERYAFELQLAPLRLDRTRGGIYQWAVEPELAYGILPRTQLEIGAPLAYFDAGRGVRKSGLAGIDISVLHNLNVETSIPALAISGDVLLPVGPLGPDKAVFSAKGIATRTFPWARFHLNAKYSFASGVNGDSFPGPGEGRVERGEAQPSRWLAGIAADRTFPLRSMLVGAEVFARQARGRGTDPQWNAAIGFRRQLSPIFNIDAGIGKQLSGDDQSWFATFGFARAFAVRSLLPGR